ncbi:MAG: carbohydrate ABC transporter permease [Clostridia bacterium]|nr:carbohydrate ABC transporter permease [Clostridia bacterium]
MSDTYSRAKTKTKISWIIAFFFAIVWLLVALIPFVFMILNSLRGQGDMLQHGVFTLPNPWILSNYPAVIEKGFFGYFMRSVIVVGVSLTLLLLVTAFASYPLSRMHFKMRLPIKAFIIAMMSVPMHVTLIPIFKMAKASHLYDTIWALIGPYVAFALPLSVFILTSFMDQTIPVDIEEAAEIDGCNRYNLFFRIILPISVPGLSTLAIYNGVSMWNEFSFANTLTLSVSAKTLPLALSQFKGENSVNTPLILTVLTLSVLPMIILFLIFQEKLIKGMMAGAVKG